MPDVFLPRAQPGARPQRRPRSRVRALFLAAAVMGLSPACAPQPQQAPSPTLLPQAQLPKAPATAPAPPEIEALDARVRALRARAAQI